MRDVELTGLANAAGLCAALSKLEGKPCPGVAYGDGFHSPVAPSWDGNGRAPGGWSDSYSPAGNAVTVSAETVRAAKDPERVAGLSAPERALVNAAFAAVSVPAFAEAAQD